MSRLRRILKWLFILGLVLLLVGVGTFCVLYWLVAPGLPSPQVLRNVEYQVPLSVYSADGKLMALFGETRRTPVHIDDVPEQVKQAFIALEDARFYEHPGVDWRGTSRAIWLLATTDDRRAGRLDHHSDGAPSSSARVQLHPQVSRDAAGAEDGA